MKLQEWEVVGHQCERFPVPGGWLYRTFADPQSVGICFVPSSPVERAADFVRGQWAQR